MRRKRGRRRIRSGNPLLLFLDIVVIISLFKFFINVQPRLVFFYKLRYSKSYVKEIDYIPEEHIVSLQVINASLTREKNDYVKYDLKTCYDIKNFTDKLEAKMNKEGHDLVATYAHLKNLLVNVKNTYGTKDSFIIFENTEEYFRPNWIMKRGEIVGELDNVISLGHYHCLSYYGDWFHDFLLPVFLIPEEVRKTSLLINNGLPGVAEETLCALGFKKSQFVYMKTKQWVFVHNLHTVINPRPYFKHFAQCSVNLSRTLREYYGTDKIVPSKYVFVNREKKYNRHIVNFEELFNEAKKRYGEYNWEIIPDFIPTVNETAKIWAPVKVVFHATGSNLVKMYFMSKDTGMCIVSADIIDDSPAKDAAGLGIYSMWFCAKGMIHFEDKKNVKKGHAVDVETAMRCLKITLYAVKYNKWPATDDFVL